MYGDIIIMSWFSKGKGNLYRISFLFFFSTLIFEEFRNWK